MAAMIPSDIQEFTTPGEQAFYRFLHACAKPGANYISWYQPDILGREPDFILYAREAGLIIFEVKDWSLDQIIGADLQNFTLNIEGKLERRKNPYRKFGNTSGRSWTRSNMTASWFQETLIPMAKLLPRQLNIAMWVIL